MVLTRSSSQEFEAELSGDEDMRDPFEHNEDVSTHQMGHQAEDSTSTKWTDEKHSLYLKSMEASFVDELYNSFESHGWYSHKDWSLDPKYSEQMHANPQKSSGQYKVFRDGCWANINYEIDELKSNKARTSHGLLANPWIRHFRSGCRCQITASCAHQENPASTTTLKHSPVYLSCSCHQGSCSSNTEVIDQNFVNEDVERAHPTNVFRAKRIKTSTVSTSSSDQVVPSGEFPERKWFRKTDNCGSRND